MILDFHSQNTMLTISSGQVHKLDSVVRSRATEHMIAHVHRHFPKPAGLAGPAAVRHLTRQVLHQAVGLELVGERDALCLLSLMLYFGSGFQHDRACTVFAAILGRKDVASPTARVQRCWREGMEFHDRIAGPAGEHADAAIRRLAGRGLARTARDETPLDAVQAQALLGEVWPEKLLQLRVQDPEAIGGLLAQVGTLARLHGVKRRGGLRALLLTAWVFGTGFAEDPMLAPLAAGLREGAGMAPEALAAGDAFLARIVAADDKP